jgi:hypothetical protein
MPPAQQCLRADNGAVDETDFRLEIDLKFFLRVGPRQFEIERAARLNLRAMYGQKKAARAAAIRFCLVQREIGISEQFFDARSVIRCDRDAGAAADAYGVLIDFKILRKPIEHCVDDLADRAWIAAFRNNQNKLVATEPEYLDVGVRVGGFDESLADLGQELVANRVAEGVVDIFEAVKIEQRDRDRTLRALAGKQPAEDFLQRQPVG